MGFKMRYPIESRYLTSNSKRRSGRRANKIRFIVAHDTGNPNSTASNNVKYYERSRNEISASAHLFVDGKEIIECIPALTGVPEKAWHVLYNRPKDNELYGCDANDCAIGIELCYGGRVNTREAYKKYVWLMAYTCHVFGLNPLKDIVGHNTLDPGRKVDPMSAFRTIGKAYPQFLRDVEEEYNLCKEKETDKLELTNYQWGILVKNIDNLETRGIINSKDWKKKAKSKELTVSELAWLNSAVLDRALSK